MSVWCLYAARPGLFVFVCSTRTGATSCLLKIGFLARSCGRGGCREAERCRLQQGTATRGTVGVNGRGWMAIEEKEKREKGRKSRNIALQLGFVTKCEHGMGDGDLSQENDTMRRGV